MIGTPVLETHTPGLRRNYLSGFELVAQSLGTLAPSASSVVMIPVIFAMAGNSTWLVFFFAMFALLLLAGQMRVFGLRLASPGRFMPMSAMLSAPWPAWSPPGRS